MKEQKTTKRMFRQYLKNLYIGNFFNSSSFYKNKGKISLCDEIKKLDEVGYFSSFMAFDTKEKMKIAEQYLIGKSLKELQQIGEENARMTKISSLDFRLLAWGQTNNQEEKEKEKERLKKEIEKLSPKELKELKKMSSEIYCY